MDQYLGYQKRHFQAGLFSLKRFVFILGVFIKYLKNSKFILHSLYFIEFFQNHPKRFSIFEIIRQFLLIKVLLKIEIIVKCWHIFQGLRNGGKKEITNQAGFRNYNRGKRDYKQEQIKGFQIVENDYKSRQGFQIGTKEITNPGRDFKSGQGLQIGAEHGLSNDRKYTT